MRVATRTLTVRILKSVGYIRPGGCIDGGLNLLKNGKPEIPAAAP